MQVSHQAGGPELIEAFKIGATVISGQAVIIGGAAGTAVATITDAATTTLTDAVGVTYGGGTYSTTQGAADVEVKCSYGSGTFFSANASGGATNNTALATTAPANVLTNTATSAGGVLITAAEVGTVDMDGGFVYGLTGANKGQSRMMVTWTTGASSAVTQPFNSSIAIGDKFVRLPWSPFVVRNLQLTTTLDQANAIIATGTGGVVCVVKVSVNIADETAPTANVTFTFRDHVMNPES